MANYLQAWIEHTIPQWTPEVQRGLEELRAACSKADAKETNKSIMPSCQPEPDKAPKCPKCGFVMCEQFDEKPVTAIASLATPNGSYICYHCKITKKTDEL